MGQELSDLRMSAVKRQSRHLGSSTVIVYSALPWAEGLRLGRLCIFSIQYLNNILNLLPGHKSEALSYPALHDSAPAAVHRMQTTVKKTFKCSLCGKQTGLRKTDSTENTMIGFKPSG